MSVILSAFARLVYLFLDDVLSAMPSSDFSNKIVALAIGLLLLLAPALILFFTISFLSFTGDLVVGRVTMIEFIELYLIDFVLFAVFAYGLYRLTKTLVSRKLPSSLDALELGDTENDTHEGADDPE